MILVKIPREFRKLEVSRFSFQKVIIVLLLIITSTARGA